jgi:hypothetical protein
MMPRLRRRRRPEKTPREMADEMDAMHEAGVKAFPGEDRGEGEPAHGARLEGGVKVYDLTAREMEWEVEPGKKVKRGPTTARSPGPDPGP